MGNNKNTAILFVAVLHKEFYFLVFELPAMYKLKSKMAARARVAQNAKVLFFLLPIHFLVLNFKFFWKMVKEMI